MKTDPSVAELETALDSKPTTQHPAPLKPQRPEDLRQKSKQVEIPTLEFISLGEAFVSKILVKFNVGDNFQNVPRGVKERTQTMSSTDRMAANLKLAVEVGGKELTEQNRLPGRVHDTALGVLGGKNIKLLQIGAMPDLCGAGLSLSDVSCQRTGAGNYVVVFEYTRTAPEKPFAHCSEELARRLEVGFSKSTNVMTTIFWNPNKSVTINVGLDCQAIPSKVLVVREHNGTPALKVEDTLRK